MINDTGSHIIAQNTNRKKTKYEIQSVQCGQVGGVRRARDVASHPRLACPMLQLCHATMRVVLQLYLHYEQALSTICNVPMLQLCHATMHYAPCSNYAVHDYALCPMLRLCHTTMHYAPCSNYAVHNYALCTMLQLCHATMHGTLCFNYTRLLTMQLALQEGTFHIMHCTLCSHSAMQLCTASCVVLTITLKKIVF